MPYITTESDDSIRRPLTAKLKKKPFAKSKVAKVMDEFSSGDLNSSSGDPVTKRPQAVAIALSEARRAKK